MSDFIQEPDFSIGILRALLWQYNRAERLESLMQSKQTWYTENQTNFWESWIRDVFDLRTANEFGLQVWAIILGIPITITTDPTDLTQPTWAFGALRENFSFGNLGQSSSGEVSLTLEQQRLILRLRYYQLVTRCTTPEINRFMAYLFRDVGTVYVLDSNDMSEIIYVFDFEIDPNLSYALTYYDVLPRPSTVGISRIITTREVFGFGEFNENFDNGTFLPAT